jgi:alkylation response protein AidB-like acyl-CoA dehydrogenase
MGTHSSHSLAGLADGARAAVAGLDRLYALARAHVAGRVCPKGELSLGKFERFQHVTHGLAWLSTYVETLRALARYAERLTAAGRLDARIFSIFEGAAEIQAQVIARRLLEHGNR